MDLGLTGRVTTGWTLGTALPPPGPQFPLWRGICSEGSCKCRKGSLSLPDVHQASVTSSTRSNTSAELSVCTERSVQYLAPQGSHPLVVYSHLLGTPLESSSLCLAGPPGFLLHDPRLPSCCHQHGDSKWTHHPSRQPPRAHPPTLQQGHHLLPQVPFMENQPRMKESADVYSLAPGTTAQPPAHPAQTLGEKRGRSGEARPGAVSKRWTGEEAP